MTGRSMQVWLLGAVLAGAVACGGDTPEVETTRAPETMGEAMQQAQAAMEAMRESNESGEAAPLVAATTLQERLPEELVGLRRASSERSQGGAMGMNISTANAEYEGEGNQRLRVTLSDVGGSAMMAGLGAAWAMIDVDRANDTGFERTVTVDGHRGFEKEERSGDDATRELSVIVGNRLLVQLEADNVSMDDLRRAFAALNVASLVPAK
jgi:hypothetical protein